MIQRIKLFQQGDYWNYGHTLGSSLGEEIGFMDDIFLCSITHVGWGSQSSVTTGLKHVGHLENCVLA